MGKYEPFDEVMAGDVIRWNGRLRKVRAVSHYPDDRVRVITFAKLRRSGYPHPTTHYWRTDIRNAFGGIVAKHVSLCTVPVECAMQKDIESDRPLFASDLSVTETDTVGLIY